jgi:GNAT superfamily N-acetyltransferase
MQPSITIVTLYAEHRTKKIGIRKVLGAGDKEVVALFASVRGHGAGSLLINECIKKANDRNHSQVTIHTTKAMQTAWKMYEKLGFKRSEDLDSV